MVILIFELIVKVDNFCFDFLILNKIVIIFVLVNFKIVVRKIVLLFWLILIYF